MGNNPCATVPLNEHQNDIIAEQNDSNTTFQGHYTPSNSLKPKNAKKWSNLKVKSFDTLKGSKSLKFGFQNLGKEQYWKQEDGNDDKRYQMGEKIETTAHLEPIVFSIIDFSVISDHSESESENRRQMSSQRFTKLLCSTRDEERSQTNAHQAAFDYILSFMDCSPHIDINREQFIRIKKLKIENDYEFKQKMGEGSFGQVYRCIDRRTRETRAIKVLKKNVLLNPKLKDQFWQEFNILRKVDHPNVLKIFQIYQSSSSLCIVSQFCEGNSLASYIKKKIDLPMPTKKEILRQLFLGVNYLHNQNILHRDLKPDNIVFINPLHQDSIPEEVDLRIIDFGLAVESKETSFKDWAHVGTYNFMAPQVFEGVYSNKCDSWSCGVIMYLLLLNFNPFRGFDKRQVQNNIKNYSPNAIDFKTVSYQAIDLILQLTKINYVMRWSIKQALDSNYFAESDQQLNKNQILTRLSNYNNTNGLVSVTESYLSFKKINQSQQYKFGKYFHTINASKSGGITTKQFQDFFNGVKGEQIQYYFNKLDRNRSGGIDFGEFLVAMGNRRELFTKENLQDVFNFIDVNKNGKLTKDEIKYFLRSLDKTILDNLIQQMTQNNKSGINFQQFSSYLLKQKWF